MSTIQVQGLRSLNGEVQIQGSKNAVLPMMAAAILNKGITVITNVPRIQDVFCMMGILEYIGCRCRLDGHELTIDAACITASSIPKQDVKCMRSSIMLLGALLGRTGEADTHYPGGCSIGERPIDLHLYVLRALGAKIAVDGEHISAKAGSLRGAEINFSFPSVGATENGILAAVSAEGTSVLRGCAREPEIEELCLFLNGMGAEISGIGTATLEIHGRRTFHDSVYRVTGDRIVAGTYLASVLAASGDVAVTGIRPGHLRAVLQKAGEMGAEITETKEAVRIRMERRPEAVRITTGPYPAFPTDMQSPMMAVMSVSLGTSFVEENIFEGRYEAAKELQKMGADITVLDRQARIRGKKRLVGAQVLATDLRGGAALVVAGLVAEGVTTIGNCYHIMRGYQDISKDLSLLGAAVTYMKNS